MTDQVSLKTERLLLRPFAMSDAAKVQRMAGVHEVSDMTDIIPYPYEDGMAEEWISKHADTWVGRTSVTFAVCRQADENLLGCVGLSMNVKNCRASLRYWFGVEFWGLGYCTEACKSLLTFAFSTLAVNRIEALHLVHNPASGAVMKKIGMQHEGTHRKYFLKNGVFSDAERYAILARNCA